ncbi:uncharacterized protein LOC112521707 [Cynara cardunculus var. scolymus]|uniref:uncharacterized protein LOC112521707 n=1 Tax=Cynara cardunculus var. scolymus TaxID=59895 RepID=UPI000D62325F|nr:uncharacterized protein LOC112521707 [Cynara cardunculus var. scolymus]
MVIDSVVVHEQSAFIKGRSILDGPIIVSEIISWAKKTNRKSLIFKIDFEKAFDTLSWDFLEDVLRGMRFGAKWRAWIKGCLSSASVAVLINGCPTREFPLRRGVRQGDPLAPLLFILAAETLNIIMSEASRKGIFSGIKLPNSGPELSILQFADDVLIMGEWSRSNATNLVRLLRCLQLSSGLKVNMQKSNIMGVGLTMMK